MASITSIDVFSGISRRSGMGVSNLPRYPLHAHAAMADRQRRPAIGIAIINVCIVNPAFSGYISFVYIRCPVQVRVSYSNPIPADRPSTNRRAGGATRIQRYATHLTFRLAAPQTMTAMTGYSRGCGTARSCALVCPTATSRPDATACRGESGTRSTNPLVW